MKVKLLLLTISNIFMLYVSDLFDFLNLNGITGIIIKQCEKNTNYIERQLRGE